MDKISKWFKNHCPNQRRLIQLYAAILYNAYIKGFIKGDIYTGNTKMVCVPGLNCYSCPGAVSACPLGTLQNALASSGQRTPAYILGILLIYGLTLGRTICGFLCPVGLLQELLHKIPTPKLEKNRITHKISYIKFVLLIVFVMLIPISFGLQNIPMPAFCKYICPAGTFEGAIGLLSNPANADKYGMLGFLFTWKFILLVMIAAICVFVFRAFCRFLCPLGAIYGLFAKVSLIGVRVDMHKCINCNKCIRMCKMDIKHVSDHECIHCGECIDICPTDAISMRAGKYTVCGVGCSKDTSEIKQKNTVRTRRIMLNLLALFILTLSLVWYNGGIFESSDNRENSDEKPSNLNDLFIETGKEVGMYAPDFAVPICGNQSTFTLSKQRGKKVVINFWATWCTPCIRELPYFDSVYRKHQEDVAVIALHANLITDDVEAYLSNFDYEMPFAIDQTGEIVKAFGGSTMLPQTIIVDENGIIIYNAVDSMTEEELLFILGYTE